MGHRRNGCADPTGGSGSDDPVDEGRKIRSFKLTDDHVDQPLGLAQFLAGQKRIDSPVDAVEIEDVLFAVRGRRQGEPAGQFFIFERVNGQGLSDHGGCLPYQARPVGCGAFC